MKVEIELGAVLFYKDPMGRNVLFLSLFALLLLGAMDIAQARSSGPRSASAHHDSRPATGFMHKHCKSDSCYKKHPSGSYSIPLHKRPH